MKLLTILIIGLVSKFAMASVSPKSSVEGYVVSFDQKIVTIDSGASRVEIPRAMYPSKVKEGEYITVAMDDAQAAKLKKSAIPSKKK